MFQREVIFTVLFMVNLLPFLMIGVMGDEEHTSPKVFKSD